MHLIRGLLDFSCLPKTLTARSPLVQVGEGSFGMVFTCLCKKTKQHLAVKIVDRARLGPKDKAQLEEEIHLLRSVGLETRSCLL